SPVVRRGGWLVMNVWWRAFGATGLQAGRHLKQYARRGTLTVATLGVGLGVVLLFGMLGWSFERTLVSILDRSLRADLIISSSYVTGGYWGAPLREDVITELSALPGIAVTAGEQSKEIPYEGGSVFVKSYDPVFFGDERLYDWPLDGDALSNAL